MKRTITVTIDDESVTIVTSQRLGQLLSNAAHFNGFKSAFYLSDMQALAYLLTQDEEKSPK